MNPLFPLFVNIQQTRIFIFQGFFQFWVFSLSTGVYSLWYVGARQVMLIP